MLVSSGRSEGVANWHRYWGGSISKLTEVADYSTVPSNFAEGFLAIFRRDHFINYVSSMLLRTRRSTLARTFQTLPLKTFQISRKLRSFSQAKDRSPSPRAPTVQSHAVSSADDLDSPRLVGARSITLQTLLPHTRAQEQLQHSDKVEYHTQDIISWRPPTLSM